MAQITIQPKPIQVEIEGYELIEIVELNKLRERADFNRYWDAKELEKRYGQNLEWFKVKIFNNPRFSDRLDEFVKRPVGGRSKWLFEPHGMARFMERNFEDVVAN